MSGHKSTGRLKLLDGIRGITIVSMILYHACWDMVYIRGADWPWYASHRSWVWQQSICWTFILLSGFCIPLSKRHYKRGLLVFGCGALVTAVTCLFMPQDAVIFGVLTLLGSAMILAVALYPLLIKIPPAAGAIACGLLFWVLRYTGDGYLRIPGGSRIFFPETLYRGYFMTYLGFRDPSFYSTDYFPLIPWFFLFLTGLYLCLFLKERGALRGKVFRIGIPLFSFFGRHSLLIYMLHQPLLYLLLVLLPGRT